MKHKLSRVFAGIGLLLLAAALCLAIYNLWDDHRAGADASGAVEAIVNQLPDPGQTDPAEAGVATPASSIGEEPAYVQNPQMAMPVLPVDGWDYLGVIRIPRLNRELPVLAEWSYPGLKKGPCRYTGSAYTSDLVIAAHNYRTHFGGFRTLRAGDEILFVDVTGNIFRYTVAGTEVLEPTAIEEMTESGFDLTLFTCTLGGQTRLAVRCTLDG